ncbi:hypothetical protein H4R23_001884 [Coemansia sp. Cherry 401B]|nr:hypothetical protein IWW54_002190 [Coemansia sp. RSA 2705]KAJ2737247.1 hypothetical protein H4R23_001884 [Coemansia sp. Cherry 401B]
MKLITTSSIVALLSSALTASADVSVDVCSVYNSYQLVNLQLSGVKGSVGTKCFKDIGGRGYVAGFINFSTNRRDALWVVDQFRQTANYAGEFDVYYNTLEANAWAKSGSTQNLDGFCDAWKKANTNPEFFGIQTNVMRQLYDQPAYTFFKQLGGKYAVTRSVLFNTAITNGFDGGPNTLASLIVTTNQNFTKKTTGSSGNSLSVNGYQVDEIVWLKKFLDVRLNANGYADQSNINSYRYIINNGAYDWKPSVKVLDNSGKVVSVDCNAIRN